MPQAQIHVRVVRAEDGAPVPQARVRLAWGDRCTTSGGEEIVADDGGQARITVADATEGEELLITATARGRAPAETGWMDWPATGSLDVVLELAAGPTVVGRVLDPTGQPLADVAVRIALLMPTGQVLSSDARWRRGDERTAADGTFALPWFDWTDVGIENTTAAVFADHPSVPQAIVPGLEHLPVHEDTRTVVVRLEAPEVVTGRVVDPAGQPIAGARIETSVVTRYAVRGTESDAHGQFRLGGLGRGRHIVAVTAPSGAGRYFELSAPLDGGAWQFPLPHTGVLRGRVLDAGGEPSAGVRVWARCDAESCWSRVDTAADGTFTCVGLPARGRAELMADGLERDVELPCDFVELRAPRWIAVAFQVVAAEDGRPLGDAAEAVGHANAVYWCSAAVSSLARLDAGGRARGHVPAGPLELWVVVPGRPATQFAVDFNEAPALPVVLRVPRGNDLLGRIRDADGRPIGGAHVVLTQPGVSGSYDEKTAVSDADGGYRITGLNARYLLACEAPDCAPHLQLVDLHAGANELDLVLGPGATIEGVVRHADGRAIAGIPVGVDPRLAGVHFVRVQSPRAMTDADGRYVLTHVPPGRAVLWAHSLAHAREIDVPAHGMLTVDLQQPGS